MGIFKGFLHARHIARGMSRKDFFRLLPGPLKNFWVFCQLSALFWFPWDSLGFLGFLKVSKGLGFFRVSQGSFGFLRVPQGSLGFHTVQYGSLEFPLGFLRFVMVLWDFIRFLGVISFGSLEFLRFFSFNQGTLVFQTWLD